MSPITPIEATALMLSLKVAFWGVVFSLPLAIALGVLLARAEFPGKILLDGFIHLPLVLPPVVVGYVLLVVFGRNGLIGSWLHDQLGITIAFTWQGAAIAAAVMGFPLMVRAIRLSTETVDLGLVAAARTLGASRRHAFVTITLPLIAPGILAGLVLAFARALGEFGATITFVGIIPGETETLPLALYGVIQSPGGEEAAIRIVLISVALAIAALGASELVHRRLRRRLYGSV